MVAVSDARVAEVWRLCCDIYHLHGRKLSLPAGTDPAKTYQWRYVTKLAQQLEEWEFDDSTARHFVEVAVGYAKAKGLMAKGLALLCQTNLLKICYDRLQADMDRAKDARASLSGSAEWVRARVANGDPVAAMTRRSKPGAYSELTRWYRERGVNDLYLALSKSAGRALNRLAETDPAERSLLPSAGVLYLLREEFTADESNMRAARAVLGGDCKKCR